MRWDALFTDLAAQWEAGLRDADEAQIKELAEAEAAGTRIQDRIRGRRGAAITVRLRDGSGRSGTIVDVAQEWVVLAEGERRHLLPAHAVAVVWPLGPTAPEPSRVERSLTLGHVLRALANEGAHVVVHGDGGVFDGRIIRVGADHLDLATAAGVLSLSWAALLSVASF